MGCMGGMGSVGRAVGCVRGIMRTQACHVEAMPIGLMHGPISMLSALHERQQLGRGKLSRVRLQRKTVVVKQSTGGL